MEPKFKSEADEIRAFDFEIRATESEETGSVVEGTPIVFGKRTDLGWYDEIIDKKALDKCDLKDVRFLVNHNLDMTPLARSRNNNKKSTMQMTVGDDGMGIRVSLDTENNSDAKNLYSAIKRGDVSGMSFMFKVRGDKWDDIDGDHPTRTITDISKVYEVSAVTFPAYEQTSISARSQRTLESARAALESAREEKKKREQDAEKRAKTLAEFTSKKF